MCLYLKCFTKLLDWATYACICSRPTQILVGREKLLIIFVITLHLAE